MRKLRKFVIAAGALFLSSMAFVSCSDDDGKLAKDTLGACFIQAITAGTDYVDLHWTITPTENVQGYKVEIYQGTIGNLGSLVTSGTFDKKVYDSTFSGLQADTKYVAVTQCIPASGSKFSKADVAYFEFWTAPNTTPTSVTVNSIKQQEMENEEGEMVPAFTEDGDPIYEASLTVNWSENLTIQQVNNIYVYMAHEVIVPTPTGGEEPRAFQDYYGTTPQISATGSTGTSFTFTVNGTFTYSYTKEGENEDTKITYPHVVPGATYYIELWPNPSNYSWFTTASAETGYIEFTMPDAE